MAGYTDSGNVGIEPEFITVRQAALALGLSPGTVYDLCYSGQITSHLYGTRRLVDVASVRAMAKRIRDGEFEPTPESA